MSQLLSRMMFGVAALLLVLIAYARSDNERVPREFGEAVGRAKQQADTLARESTPSENAGDAWVSKHSRVEDDLIAIANDVEGRTINCAAYGFPSLQPVEERYAAIRALGNMRCRKAVPVLLKNLEWYRAMTSHDASNIESFPCLLALSQIGIGCAPQVLWHVQATEPEEMSDLAVEMCAYLLYCFYMNDLVIGGPTQGKQEAIDAVERVVEFLSVKHSENLKRLADKIREETWQRGMFPPVPVFPLLKGDDAIAAIRYVAPMVEAPKETENSRLLATCQEWLIQASGEELTLLAVAGRALPDGVTDLPRQRAVRLLGRLGPKSALRILLDNIDWQQTQDDESPFKGYPCAQALAEFGFGCVPDVIWQIDRPRRNLSNKNSTIELSGKRVELHAKLLVHLYTVNPAMGGENEGANQALAAIDRYSRLVKVWHPRNLAWLKQQIEKASHK